MTPPLSSPAAVSSNKKTTPKSRPGVLMKDKTPPVVASKKKTKGKKTPITTPDAALASSSTSTSADVPSGDVALPDPPATKKTKKNVQPLPPRTSSGRPSKQPVADGTNKYSV